MRKPFMPHLEITEQRDQVEPYVHTVTKSAVLFSVPCYALDILFAFGNGVMYAFIKNAICDRTTGNGILEFRDENKLGYDVPESLFLSLQKMSYPESLTWFWGVFNPTVRVEEQFLRPRREYDDRNIAYSRYDQKIFEHLLALGLCYYRIDEDVEEVVSFQTATEEQVATVRYDTDCAHESLTKYLQILIKTITPLGSFFLAISDATWLEKNQRCGYYQKAITSAYDVNQLLEKLSPRERLISQSSSYFINELKRYDFPIHLL